MQDYTSQKPALFLRMLLNKYFTGKADQLAKLMPKEELDGLNANATPVKEPTLVLFNSDAWLKMCDPSWYASSLKLFPSQLQEAYFPILPLEITNAFLTFENREKLQAAPESHISPAVREFLLGYLYKQWQDNLQEDEPLPKELIEPSELSPLLSLKRNELLEVVDLLSMHNLVDEVRHVVDKRILQTLSQVLSNSQQQYLRMCLRQKTKYHAPTFSLRERLAEPKKLPQLLHKQGLKRLGVALSGEQADLIWHIMHALDIGRAKYVQADIQEEQVVHSTKLAKLEILQVLQFLKTSTKT